MIRFASPLFLFLIPALIVLLLLRNKYLPPRTILSSALPGHNTIRQHWSVTVSRFLPALGYIAMILAIIALARPQWGVHKTSVKTHGINIVLAVDTSNSMAAMDFTLKGKAVTRLDAVKSVVKSFIGKRQNDRIGLVVFGSEAYTQIPLTRDYATIDYVIDRIKMGAAGPYTAIGDAIGVSVKRLSDVDSKTNIIILLTDGESNTGVVSPEDATQVAKDKNVRIHTIGIGSTGTAPFLVKDPIFGNRIVSQPVHLDEDTLRIIADTTGGSYHNAKNTRALANIYAAIDSLEKTRVDVEEYTRFHDWYSIPLTASMVLMFLFLILTHTRFLRVP